MKERIVGFARSAGNKTWVLWCGFLLCAAVLLCGAIKLYLYSFPMWLGRNDYAATKCWFYDEQPEGEQLFAYEPPLKYRILNSVTRYTYKGLDKLVGDRSAAMYNAGLTAYFDEHDYGHARACFTKAYNELCDSHGKVSPSNRKFASQLQLLIANSYANSGQKEEAISALESSLSLDPNNLTATWNMEWLKDSKDNGKSKPTDDQDPKPTSPRKRI